MVGLSFFGIADRAELGAEHDGQRILLPNPLQPDASK
jgi:hypothetical protein